MELKRVSEEGEEDEEYPDLSIGEWHKKNGCYV